MKVPVLVLAFNRPEHVKKAMEPICEYQPERLYLACDGPRADKEGEALLVADTQKAMKDAVDWSCDVKTFFRDNNLGCAVAVYEAISWFFEHEENGIIIEDDVIVGKDFFILCEDLLSRYASEEQIMEIAAQNHSDRSDITNTYVYTHTSHCWGWASWRRAWSHMDMSMSLAKKISPFDLVKKLGLFRGLMMKYYFTSAFRRIDTFNSWATRWYLSIMGRNGLIICPGVNLAINIGMDGGTHYGKGDINPYADLKICKIKWPLVYNDSLMIDKRQKKLDSQDFFYLRMIGFKMKLKKASDI